MTTLLSPRVNLVAGVVVAIASTVWTLLSILLTSPSASQANVLAMSGVALVGFGVQLVQGSAQMRKIEVNVEPTEEGCP